MARSSDDPWQLVAAGRNPDVGRTGEVRDDPLALADARARKGQHAEALEILLRVTSDTPRYPEAVAQAVRLAGSHGLMSLKVDRFVGPFLQGRGRLAHGPGHVPTLYLLGRLYEDMDFGEEAFAGLGEAHARGVVHRDVKPRNLFVCESGRLKVMDFGIAKVGGALEQQHTATGQVVGTPAYIPPERLRADEDELGPSVDIYAMGVCLYRMFTGVLPFAARHVETLFMKILDQEPARPSILNPAVPPGLGRLVLRLLEKDPKDRYPDCGAAAAAVEALR